MVQGFYNLDEAAQRLGMSIEELTQMAQRREVRAFADRGTWRFRTQDIEEMARQRGLGSDPSAPVAGGKGEVFPFELSGQGQHGTEVYDIGVGKEKRAPVSSESDIHARKSRSTVPADSDPKLVPDEPSSVKLAGETTPREGDSAVPIGREPVGGGSSVSDLGQAGSGRFGDSGVRLVDDEPPASRVGKKGKRTEVATPSEVNLDEEIRLARESGTGAPGPRTPPTPLPFKIPEEDVAVSKPKKPAGLTDSSDIDLIPSKPGTESSVSIDLGELPSDSDLTRASGTSGLNLQSPADSGISLEQGSGPSDDLSFELSLDESASSVTPKPKKKTGDSSSEFDLSLEEGSGIAPLEEEKKDVFDSDFKVPALEGSDSDNVGLSDEDSGVESSDFELALDDENLTIEDTGSEVVVIEEGADEADETAIRPQLMEGEIEEEAGEEMVAVEAEEEEEAALAAAAAEAQPVEWGPLPTILLAPAAFVMVLIGFLLFEMLNSVWSYSQPNAVTGQISEMFGKMFGK